jgi:hypothetical protein
MKFILDLTIENFRHLTIIKVVKVFKYIPCGRMIYLNISKSAQFLNSSLTGRGNPLSREQMLIHHPPFFFLRCIACGFTVLPELCPFEVGHTLINRLRFGFTATFYMS